MMASMMAPDHANTSPVVLCLSDNAMAPLIVLCVSDNAATPLVVLSRSPVRGLCRERGGSVVLRKILHGCRAPLCAGT